LATDAGCRIYTDTTFLGRVQREFYTEYTPDSIRNEVSHFCGHDVYLYEKTGTNLRLIKTLNSECGADIQTCTYLHLLAEAGRQLRTDTLRTESRERWSINDLQKENILFISEIDNHGHWLNSNSGYHNAHNHPYWYYDGYFHKDLIVDTVTPINLQINRFFEASGIDSLRWQKINYSLDQEANYHINFFTDIPVRTDCIRIHIYLDEELFPYFGNEIIRTRNSANKQLSTGLFPVLIVRY
jgi:hypothetical protein